MFLVVGLAVSLFVTTTFQCSPVAYAWDKSIRGGHCINLGAYFRWLSFPNILTDAVILVLPLPLLWRLHTSTGQKIGVTCVFVVGSLFVFPFIQTGALLTLRIVALSRPHSGWPFSFSTMPLLIKHVHLPGRI